MNDSVEQLDMFRNEDFTLRKLESMEKIYLKELKSRNAWRNRISKRIRELEAAIWNIEEHRKLIKKVG